MKKIAIFPGTFDPITKGHVALIQRAAKLFDQLIVAIADSSRKGPLFSLDVRLKFAKEACRDFKNVEVDNFTGLLVTFAKQCEAKYIVRGLRCVTDFDYEFHLAGMNQELASELETIFLPARPKEAYVSATLVREIISLQGDVSPFVPAVVIDYLQKNK